jgi:hypothetical protein
MTTVTLDISSSGKIGVGYNMSFQNFVRMYSNFDKLALVLVADF